MKVGVKMMFGCLILLLVVMVTQVVADTACSDPLGMESGVIKDSHITVTGMYSTAGGMFARLNKDEGSYGAWCLNQRHGTDILQYDQSIKIDLVNVTKITKVATQGRYGSNGEGKEKVETYKISYSNDNSNWKFYGNKSSQVFKGNDDTTTVVSHELNPPIYARYIRIHPGYYKQNLKCLRLELYGCQQNGTVPARQGIVSYSMPQGQSTKNNKVHYKDTSYSRTERNGILDEGVGLLTDGKFGPVDSKEDMGGGWVGWNGSVAEPHGVNITFEFNTLRRFNNVTVTMNINSTRKNMPFNKSRIFFATTKDDLFEAGYLEYKYCPKLNEGFYNLNITLPLCENVGKFVVLQFYLGGRWMLFSEISFDSVPTEDNVVKLQNCNDLTCEVENVPTTLHPTTESPCIDCANTTPVEGAGSNLSVIIVIVCVVLLFIIIILVVVFFLYRRRMLCFTKFKRQGSKSDVAAVHVELSERESALDGTYDKVNDDIGNPLYAGVDKSGDKEPMLSPVKKRSKQLDDIKIPDNRESDFYAEPDVGTSPKARDEYAEPVDSLTTTADDDIVGNPIYAGTEDVYSEPLYGVTGTILVGPQEETLKRGYTMDKFPSDHLVFKEKIGDGQFGEVHIAEADIGDLRTTLGEDYKGKTKITVAVKTLKKDVSSDIKTDFFKEVRVMSRLQHDNVVRLLGVCRDEPICMIVEYMENGDLNQFLRGHVFEGAEDEMVYANTKQPINYDELLYIAFQVAAGMNYFASMNLVHRDLAARNCLVGEGLTVKLADFGMSRLLYSKHYYRVQGRVMLPIRWMAPESIFQGRFTTQTDVWSFGITLWEIFTLASEFPYPNLSDEQVIANAKTAFSKPSAQVIYNSKPDVCTRDVYDMMLRCWSSNPEKRPQFDDIYDFFQEKVGPVGSAVV